MSGTVFKQVNFDINGLVKFIEMGHIGLPDIQRPFVWSNTKVRDLFDSMYKGYPVGYLLLWENAFVDSARQIGVEDKQKIPNLLIVDGQQRLTSLYAVIRGIQVLRENFSKEQIAIAFSPLQEKFEVADAAIRRDKSYIPNISALWDSEVGLVKFVNRFLADLRAVREITLEEEEKISESITRLYGLLNFPFTALELSASISEEDVADVFVRINSKGTPLNQADFILTLMSVFWDEGRAQLEEFCRNARQPAVGQASPFNHFIYPDPDQLLRVAVALGFKRARLSNVYSILRGKDLESGEFSSEQRDRQFNILKAAQARVINVQHWHDFFKAVMLAGHRSARTISSQTALIYSYAFYLIGRTEYKVDEHTLRRVIARWFFMTSLTGRYSSSPESAMEFDLARLREVKDADTFVRTLERVAEETLTGDFWSITLPNELATSSPRSPSLFGYYASLVLLEAKVLFSDMKVVELLDPAIHANRSAIERHHLFPRGHLKRIGVTSLRDTNQIANFALVEWGDNADVSDKAPVDYFIRYEDRLKHQGKAKAYYWHALPEGWESMQYADFLMHRRELMSQVIQDGYKMLTEEAKTASEPARTLEDLVLSGETSQVEFKAALRMNLHTRQADPRIELSALKTIAGFLNTRGGTLIIGVTDEGTPIGVEEDGFSSEDKLHQHLDNLIKGRIGPEFTMWIHPRFEEYQDKRVLAVECWESKKPVFVKDGSADRFYIRTGVSTTELTTAQAHEFIKQRFH